jgi:hypothetical protein
MAQVCPSMRVFSWPFQLSELLDEYISYIPARMASLRLLLPALTLGTAALAQNDEFQARCESFANEIDIPHVKVNLASYLPGGTNLSLVDNDPSCGASYQGVTADTCRIAMAVATSNSSEITLEAWFPREYNGRFLSTGNGGLSGCMFVAVPGEKAYHADSSRHPVL